MLNCSSTYSALLESTPTRRLVTFLLAISKNACCATSEVTSVQYISVPAMLENYEGAAELTDRLGDFLFRALQDVCGGDDDEGAGGVVNGACRNEERTQQQQQQQWHRVLESSARKSILLLQRRDGVEVGKPWDIEIRVAPALFQRFRCKRNGTWTVRSRLGLERTIATPLELGELLLPVVEENLSAVEGIHDVRCHPNGFLCITSPPRAELLRQSGLLPCPKCEKWLQGEKGVWWHCQQQHKTDHSVAAELAISQRNENAMIVYDQRNSDPFAFRFCGATSTVGGEKPPETPEKLGGDPWQYIKAGDI